MLTCYDELQRALEQALGRITVDPDAAVEDVRLAIAAAEDEAYHEVAARWLAEARQRRDLAAQRASEAAERQAAAERAERELRKKLGDGVNPNARYWLLTHKVGVAAFPRDAAEEDFGVNWSPPVIAGRRSERRNVQGIELARVDGVVVVADHREARARLLDLAAQRAKREPAGVIEPG